MGRFLPTVICTYFFSFLVSSAGYTQDVTPMPNEKVADSTRSQRQEVFGVDVTAASALAETVRNEVMSEEMVDVPKKYIYGLVSMLVLLAVLVQFSRRSHDQKRRSRRIKNHGSTESSIARNEAGFTNYVLSLFDPHLFNIRNYDSRRSPTGWSPGLRGEFRKESTEYSFVLEVLYLQRVTGGKVLELSAERIQRYRSFQMQHHEDVYLVIGIEGEPSFPNEVYLLEASALASGTIGYEDVQPYRKYGMFSFHSGADRLQ